MNIGKKIISLPALTEVLGIFLLSVGACLAMGIVRIHAASATTTAASSQRQPPPDALIYAASMPDLKTAPKAFRRIELYRNGSSDNPAAVTLGIPFPPGLLQDASAVHIVDAHGTPVPAHVESTMLWHFAGGGIRSVRVQFHVPIDGDHASVYFQLGKPQTGMTDDWPYTDGLVTGKDGIKVPGILATLSPQWMSASMIAGPQQPAIPLGAYDRYFATQFQWARKLPLDSGPAWLFDRPTTLFQQYVRTGNKDYLANAIASYHFYMQHIQRTGAPGWPRCGGGFSLGRVKACDPKYVYIEPIKLALALTGDNSEHDDALIQLMVGSWDTGGWNNPVEPYLRPNQRFTEREAGLGLLEVVSAWEITGNKAYLRDVEGRIDQLYQHQKHNPDQLGDDGSWRNSWDAHEGNTYNAATDVRGTSPWMTQMIIDGLWHAWLATGDKRIPVMIADFGRYMEKHGWIKPSQLVKPHDWRFPCSGPDGQISWYWSSAHASTRALDKIQNSEGWYSDSHNVELTLAVAAARYFDKDTRQDAAYKERMRKLAFSYNTACATNASTPRRFNWNNRGTGVVQWLIGQPAGSGLSVEPADKPAAR